MSSAVRGAGSPPLHAGALDAPASLDSLRFGVFRRMRSSGGADVFPRGLPTRGARPIEQVPLAEALTRRWDDDRHIVLYTSDKPYRINNGALDKVRVEVRLLAFDVDNHDNAPGWMDRERPKIDALLAAHPGGFAHATKRGWRVYFALPRPIPICSEADKQAWVLFYARVAAYVFERFEIAIDPALIRWNQPIRLPHVVRDGRVFDAEILAGEPRALGAFELPEHVPETPELRALAAVIPTWGGIAKQWQPKRELFRVASSAWDGVPLPPYAERVAAASTWVREHAPRAVMGQGGRATARSVAACLHVGFALERADVERLLVGAYNRRRCSPPWQEGELEDLQSIARSVAQTPVQVPGFMLSRDRTGIEAARLKLTLAAGARSEVPLEKVPARIARAIEAHRAVVVRATCGAGKTTTVARWIAAATTGRVFIVISRHELGRAWVEALAAAGETDVAYHASVVQRRDEAGRRYCDNKLALKLYARGGDVRRDVCVSCPRKATCPAFAMKPNTRARVHVLPREMIPSVGITDEDLVVFDDSAVDLLVWHRLTVKQLRRLTVADPRLMSGAQGRYLGGFVRALLAGARQADGVARAALKDDAPVAALRELAARAVDGQRTPWVPSDIVAEGGDELEATLRDAGTLRDVLRFASACADGAEIQWSEGVRSVHGESAAAKLLRSHQGRLVVLDGAANVEELRALCADLAVERLDVPDAGSVHRVLLFEPHANRAALHDASARPAVLERWLKAALAKLSARGVRRAVVVSYKHVIAELREHPAALAWLAEHPRRRLRFAHFGAVRGSNRFRHTQAVVTLGDPWFNGDDVVGRAARLALDDEPSYRIALAEAELGQVHGRSRSVRRRRRLTHVHVGRLVPDGWAHATVEPLGGPPQRSRAEADRLAFVALVGAVGGERAAAKALGCSRSAVTNWKTGRRALPLDALARLRAATATQISASSGEAACAGRGMEMDTVLCKYRSKGRVHPAGGEGRGSEEAVKAGPLARPEPPEKNLTPPVIAPVCERDATLPVVVREESEVFLPVASDLADEPKPKADDKLVRSGERRAAGTVPDERLETASPLTDSEYAARVIAMLDGVGVPGVERDRGPPRGRPVRAFGDDELAGLRDAEERARRRYRGCG